jgi:hypothetical protein
VLWNTTGHAQLDTHVRPTTSGGFYFDYEVQIAIGRGYSPVGILISIICRQLSKWDPILVR